VLIKITRGYHLKVHRCASMSFVKTGNGSGVICDLCFEDVAA